MKVKGTELLHTYRASVLGERFNQPFADMKRLKAGHTLQINDDVAGDMIAAGLVVTEGTTTPELQPSHGEDL